MNGVGDLPPSMSQSMSGEMMAAIPSPTTPTAAPANNVMSQSMMAPSSSPLTTKNDLMTSSTSSLNMKTGKKYIPSRSRADLATKEREREERVRRLKEMQEEDRRRKLEELKQHALQAQKFREQQDLERRRHIETLRMKDMDRRMQVEERRKEIEKSELERKEAIIAKNKERDQRLISQRKNSRSNIEFAFGSSAPRMMEPRVDSASGYWGTRRATSSIHLHSASGQTMFERSSTSQERDSADNNLRSKRTASAQGLNVATEGEDGALSPGVLTAHRRRTDLVPTIVMSRTERGGCTTPGSRHRSPGRAVSMSRIDLLSLPRQQAKHVTSVSVSPSKSMSHLAVSASQNMARRGQANVLQSTNSNRQRQRPRPSTLELAALKDQHGELLFFVFLSTTGLEGRCML